MFILYPCVNYLMKSIRCCPSPAYVLWGLGGLDHNQKTGTLTNN